MIISGAGSYKPSNYEAVTAGWQQSSMQSLLDYAAMNSARAQAAQRTAVNSMFGGSMEQQQRMLYGTRGGAMIRYGSQFMEGMYGSGSYVDMMAGNINMAQNAGFSGSAFGRQATSVYGAGPVTDILARRMFDRQNQYFSNASGSDSLMRTQGLSLTDLSVLQQTMAANGAFAGRNVLSVERAGLADRARSAARDLSANGNVQGSQDILKAINQGGTEATLKNRLQELAKTTGSGDIKGVIDSAINSTSITKVNDRELDNMNKEVTQMAKVLNKFRNIYGEVASSDIFKVASSVSANKDPNKLLADIESFQRMARTQGMGDNLQGLAQQQAGVVSMLSGVFGSKGASAMGTDVMSNIITQQRLALKNQQNLTPEQIQNSVAGDVANTGNEANFQEARRLAYEAKISGDPAKIAAAEKLAQAMTNELDITKQSEAIAAATSVIGNQRTLATAQEQETALAGTPLGNSIAKARIETAKRSVIRIYEEAGSAKGVTDNATYTGALEALGTDRFKTLAEGKEKLSKEDIAELKGRGVNVTSLQNMLSDPGQRSILLSATSDVLAKDKAAGISGAAADRDLKKRLNQDAIKSAKYGNELADPYSGESVLRLGLKALIDPEKAVTEKDVRDYAFATSKGALDFSTDMATGKLIMTDAQIQEMAKKTGIDPAVLKGFTESETGMADFQSTMTANKFTIGVGPDGRGIALSTDDIESRTEELKKSAKETAMNRLGLAGLTGLNAEDAKEKAGDMLRRDFGEQGLAEQDSEAEAALRGVKNVVHGTAYDNTEEGISRRRQDAIKLKTLIDASGADEELDTLGDSILTDDAYADLRTNFGIGDLTEEMRKNFAKDSTTGRDIAKYALSQAGAYEPSKQEQELMERLRNNGGGGGNQNIAHMTVQHLEVIKQS